MSVVLTLKPTYIINFLSSQNVLPGNSNVTKPWFVSTKLFDAME